MRPRRRRPSPLARRATGSSTSLPSKMRRNSSRTCRWPTPRRNTAAKRAFSRRSSRRSKAIPSRSARSSSSRRSRLRLIAGTTRRTTPRRGNCWAIPRRTSWSGACVLSRPPRCPSSSPARVSGAGAVSNFGVASMASSSTPSMRRVSYTQDQPRPRRQRPGEIHGLRG